MSPLYTSRRVLEAAKLCDMLDHKLMVLDAQVETLQDALEAAEDEHWDAMMAEEDADRVARRRETANAAQRRYKATRKENK